MSNFGLGTVRSEQVKAVTVVDLIDHMNTIPSSSISITDLANIIKG